MSRSEITIHPAVGRVGALQHRQLGFIITVELLLVMTILVIGSFVGVVAIRDALVKQYAARTAQNIFVLDANGTRLGQAIGFDEHEAPRIPYVDRSVAPLAPDPEHRNYRALIAVRDDRFTTREPVYYSGENCSGTPCVKIASDELTDNIDIGGVAASGAVSYLYAVQASPVYAVGASDAGIPGRLYRSGVEACPVEPSAIQSRYMSQKVVSGVPCEPYSLGQEGPAQTTCLADLGGVCECPSNYEDQGDVLSNYAGDIDTLLRETSASLNAALGTPGVIPTVDVGEVCCPVGTRLRDDGNVVNAVVYNLLRNVLDGIEIDDRLVGKRLDPILEPLAGTLYCESLAELRAAVSVPDPDRPDRNVLDAFSPPFVTNLPADVGAGSDWISTPPDGEGFNTRN